MKNLIPIIATIFLTACAGGPPHDYYNPRIVGAKYPKPITIELVDDISAAKDRLEKSGAKLIGTADYSGGLPKSIELEAQAKRSGANHVVYSAKWHPNPPGSWNFRFGGGGGSGAGGAAGGADDVSILFFGVSR